MNTWQEYIDAVDDESKSKALVYVLTTAEKYVPNAERVISYQMPTIKTSGKAVIAVAPWKNHIGLYPFGSAAAKIAESSLKNAEISKGTIQFKYDQLPTEAQIKAIIEAKLSTI